MRLEGKVAIVTGGAHGMGESEALIFAREGATVVVADVDQAAGEPVAAKIRGNGGTARFVRLDVTDERQWEDLIRDTVAAYGRLDILVNNAGISGSSGSDVTSTPLWDSIMDVNAKGVFLGMKHAVPAMRRSGGGAIVNISSISGFVGQDRLHMAYNASKGAVRIMTKSGAVQYARDGVRVNSVHPERPTGIASRASCSSSARRSTAGTACPRRRRVATPGSSPTMPVSEPNVPST